MVGLQLTLIFSFKLVPIFKSSWQGTFSNNQKKKINEKREAISIHSFVHEGGRETNNSKGKAKNGIPKCWLEISRSSKKLNKRWKVGGVPLLNPSAPPRGPCSQLLASISRPSAYRRRIYTITEHLGAPPGLWPAESALLFVLFPFNEFVISLTNGFTTHRTFLPSYFYCHS